MPSSMLIAAAMLGGFGRGGKFLVTSEPAAFHPAGAAEDGMAARRLRITGRVQGVGYRDWMVREARRLAVTGWVRNRRDGSVEALVAGPEPAVQRLLLGCRLGPPGAWVDGIEESLAEPPEEPGFLRLPTA
jgi:acylphosphatase